MVCVAKFLKFLKIGIYELQYIKVNHRTQVANAPISKRKFYNN
jgi:hypothetical protein